MKIASCILTAMMVFMFMDASCSENTPDSIIVYN